MVATKTRWYQRQPGGIQDHQLVSKTNRWYTELGGIHDNQVVSKTTSQVLYTNIPYYFYTLYTQLYTLYAFHIYIASTL